MRIAGYALFLFIPLVLVLFVRHPEPIAASLAAGVGLMIGHRFLARPYMERVRAKKCVWCNRPFGEAARREVELAGGAPLVLFTCPEHERPTRAFFGFLDRCRWVLRLGIFLPLLALLGSLAVAAFDRGAMPGSRLADVTAIFQLAVGIAVNIAAFGYLAARPAERPAAVFPTHNFYLLGVRSLLWVFRLVGVWWIWRGVAHFV